MNSFLLFVFAALGTIIIIELNTGNVPSSAKNDEPIKETTVKADANNYMAAVSGSDILLWKNSTSNSTKRLKFHKAKIESLTFSTDSRWLLSTDKDGISALWQTRHGKFVVEVEKLKDSGLLRRNLTFTGVDAYTRSLIFETRSKSKIFYNYSKGKILEEIQNVAIR